MKIIVFLILCVMLISCNEPFKEHELKLPARVIAVDTPTKSRVGAITIQNYDGEVFTLSGYYLQGASLIASYKKGDTIK